MLSLIATSVPGIVGVSCEPLGNLPESMAPVAAKMGKTTTPVGNYVVIAGIAVLAGSEICPLIGSLTEKIRERSR